MELDKLRQQINEIDKSLISLIKQRFELTHKIGVLKKRIGLPIRDKRRERQVLEMTTLEAQNLGLDKKLIKSLYKAFMKQAVKNNKNVVVNNDDNPV